jgi:peptidoglycan/LPS O-acetylase OafA/YrhL
MFSGIVLAEFSLSSLPERLSSMSAIISPPLAILGLVIMSYPSDHPHTATWSKFLQELGLKLFPPQGEIGRTWGSVGCILLLVAIIISPHLRRLLSRRPLLWLGKISFPVYLLHGTFMRSLLAWITFAGQEPQPFEVQNGENQTYQIHRYPQPGSARIFVAIIISMGAMLFASHHWAKSVEPVFGKITKRAEEIMFSNGGGGSGEKSNTRPILPTRKE